MQAILRCQSAQHLEDIDAGYALLQRTAIKAGSNQQRDSVGDHQVGVIVNLLQASFLFQLNDVLRVGSDDIRRLTAVLRMGDDRRADLLRRAVVDQSVADADSSYIRSPQRGARGSGCRKPMCCDIHVSALRNARSRPYLSRISCRKERGLEPVPAPQTSFS